MKHMAGSASTVHLNYGQFNLLFVPSTNSIEVWHPDYNGGQLTNYKIFTMATTNAVSDVALRLGRMETQKLSLVRHNFRGMGSNTPWLTIIDSD